MAKNAKTGTKALVKVDAKVNAREASAAPIVKNITLITKGSKAMHEMVATTAAMCVVHAIEHGDVTLAERLINATGAAWRNNDMRAWFIEFGPFRWGDTNRTDKEGKAIKGFKLHQERQGQLAAMITTPLAKQKFMRELKELPMWKWKKEPVFKGYDLLKALSAQINQAEKANEKYGTTGKVNIVGLDIARKAIKEIEKARAQAEAA